MNINKEMHKLAIKNSVNKNLMQNKEYCNAIKELNKIFNELMNTVTDKKILFKYDSLITKVESMERKECYRMGFCKGISIKN